jgi:Flp pilus assembly protein TadD
MLYVSYRLIQIVLGPTSIAFHVFGLLLHALALLGGYLTLRLLSVPHPVAFGASALFAFHPVASETVYWAANLSEQILLLGALGMLSGLLFAERSKGIRRGLWLTSAYLSTSIALLSKETGWILPPLATVLVLWNGGRAKKGRGWAVLPIWGLAVLYYFIRSATVGELGSLAPTGEWLPRLGLAGYGLFWGVRRLLLPYPLTPFPPFPEPAGSSGYVVFGLMAVLALLIGAVFLWQRRRRWSFWAGWICLPLLPPLFVLITAHLPASGVILADRHLLLSLIPGLTLVAWVATWALERLETPETRRTAGVVGLGLACVLGGQLSANYGSVFRNDDAFFAHALRHAPHNPAVLSWVGALSIERGDFEGALPFLHRALEAEPKLVHAHLNLATAWLRLKRPERAAPFAQRALELGGEVVGAHLLLAHALRDTGKFEEAGLHYRKELEIDPGSVPAWLNLGSCYFVGDKKELAIAAWEKALHFSPEHPEALYNLTLAHRELGYREQWTAFAARFIAVAGENYSAQRKLVEGWLIE